MKLAPIDECIAIFHGIWGGGEWVRVINGRVGCVGKLVPGDLGDRRHVAWGTGVVVHILDGFDTVAAASYEVCAASYASQTLSRRQWKSLNLLLVQARIQDKKIGTLDGELLGDCVTALLFLGSVILATVLGAVFREVGRDRDGGRSCGRPRDRSNRGWSFVLFSRLIHTEFGADGAVEVIATAVNPRVVRAQLNRSNVVGLRDALTGISLLDCVGSAMVLDAQFTRFREVSTVGLELVVHEKLVGSDALRLGD